MATAVGLVAALGVVVAPAAGAQARGSGFKVIASHLNNPRGLAWGPGGAIFLAEAGRGGKTCLSGGPQGKTCIGLTGSFDVISKGGVHRVATGLISASGAGGVAAEGLVSVSRAPHGGVFALFGENTHIVPPKGAIPQRLRQAALRQLGRLFLGTRHGVVSIARVGDHDWTWTSKRVHLAPKDFPDANPDNVLRAGGRTYVVDAGANTLTQVLRHGRTQVRAFFPVAHYPPDSVPTCAAQGPDGALYVAELLGGSYAPGHARVWRIVPGQKPKVWATGLTTVQGCGFGSDGAFYATEFQTGGLTSSNPAGDVVRIAPNGHRTHLGVGKLFNPSGFLAGRNGSFYVSNCSIAPATGLGPKLCPTGGQVVRIG
ncbi:MAG TPA: ScyD/ScyE family protein [Streptosporangiaceae bacterium]